MRSIRIINGVYGYQPKGSSFIEPKRAGDPPFEVDDEKAAELVASKTAEYADDMAGTAPVLAVATPVVEDKDMDAGLNITEEESTPEDEITAPDKPAYSVDTNANELREIMSEFGLSFKVGMTKEDMVSLLDDFFDDQEENNEDPDQEEGNESPDQEENNEDPSDPLNFNPDDTIIA